MANYPILSGCTCGWQCPPDGAGFEDHRCTPHQQAEGWRKAAHEIREAVLLGGDHGRATDADALEDAARHDRIADKFDRLPDPDRPRDWRDPSDYVGDP